MKKLAPAITNYLFSKELAPMSNGGTSANYLVFYSNSGTGATDNGGTSANYFGIFIVTAAPVPLFFN